MWKDLNKLPEENKLVKLKTKTGEIVFGYREKFNDHPNGWMWKLENPSGKLKEEQTKIIRSQQIPDQIRYWDYI